MRLYKNNILLSCIFALFSVSISLININDSFAAASTISLTISNSTLSVGLTPNYSSGNFAKSGSSTISVSTNNYSGYTLGLKAATSGTNATNLVNGSNTLTSISSAISESTFSSVSGTTYNNMWGILPSKYASSANTDYRPAPNTNGVILDATNIANASSNTYTLAIGARVDQTAAPGTYTNAFIVTAVANLANYNITYNANAGSDTVTNMPSPNPLAGATDATTVSLSSTVPVRSGYTFKGWCSTTTNDETCSGTTYNPNGDGTNLAFPIDQTGSNTKTIYAMWQGLTYIQDYDIATCAAEASDHNVTVIDRRDGNDYTVRYINGRCWMTQNLRFQGTTISSSDTNINTSKTITWYSLKDDSGCKGTNLTTDNTTLMCSDDSGSPETGVWYTYAAATAGTITGTSNSSAATYDICPKGWHLPTGPNTTIDTDLNKLIGNATSSWQDPTSGLTAFGAVAGGFYNNGSLGNLGRAYWWSTVASSTSGRYRLGYNSSIGQFEGDNKSDRHRGFFVRCVTKVTYLQDQTASTLATNLPNTGDVKVYADKRDGESYFVSKLADGNYWLLDNLRLDTSDSSVLSNITASNTNATSISLNYMKNGGGTTSDKYPTAKINNVAWTSASQNYYSIPMTVSTYKDTTITRYGAGSGKIGVYYNYCAATAGSYCYGNGTSSGSTSGGAFEDLCPSGWRMPTGGSSGEYVALDSAYSSDTTSLQNALSASYSSFFVNGAISTPIGQEVEGGFWSSSRSGNASMFHLLLDSSGFNAAKNSYRYNARSIRCIFGNHFLQDQTSATLAKDLPSAGSTKTYIDKRDGEPYLIGKLADNKYWMLDNLRLDPSVSDVLSNITADNTNASSTTINYFKNGGGSTSDKYPTSEINKDTWSFSLLNKYSIPLTYSGAKNDVVTGYGSGSKKVGVYYNFCAASAGSYCYGNGVLAGSSSGNATEDICPKGWRLPTGGTSGEYKSLLSAYSSNVTSLRNALSIALSGYYSTGSKSDLDTAANFATSTRYNNSVMNYTKYTTSDGLVLDETSGTRNTGNSIRCLKK